MAITTGDPLPNATLHELTADGTREVPVEGLVRKRRVVLFGLPGAFTPTCSARHVPGYLALADKIRALGVDEIACARRFRECRAPCLPCHQDCRRGLRD